MTTLIQKMKYRNTALVALYQVIRPSMGLLVWAVVDFSKMVEFRMLTRGSHIVTHLTLFELIQSFYRLSVSPILIPFILVGLVDLFVLEDLFKKKVIKCAAI